MLLKDSSFWCWFYLLDPIYTDNRPVNLKEINLKDISYNAIRKFNIEWKSGLSDGRRVPKFYTELFKIQIEDPKFKELLNSEEKFDLLIIEEGARPYIVMSHIFKAPVILISSLGVASNIHHYLGSDTHPLLYPTHSHQRIYNLTIWEKIYELYKHYKLLFWSFSYENVQNDMMQEYFPGVPRIRDLYKNVDMLFLNIHPIWVDNQPVPPNVVFLGGLHQSEPKSLPEDLKAYLDASNHGVIYLSFGTNALSSLLPVDKVSKITSALGHLPYDVLWKWDKDELPGQTTNIKLVKWVPQADLLKHPKIKLFVTQAGLQSTDEAIAAGVPIIGIPVLGDQWYNAEKYERHGIGLKLLFDDITRDIVKATVEKIINDESYRQNIQKLRAIMRDQPQPPLDRAIFWINHTLKHGGQHLQASGANMSWARYYECDVLVLLLCIVVIVPFVVGLCIYLCLCNVNEKVKKS